MTLDKWLPADRQRTPHKTHPAPRDAKRLNSLRVLWNNAADDTSRRMVDRLCLEWFGRAYTLLDKQNECPTMDSEG